MTLKLPDPTSAVLFGGETYDAEFDEERLVGQLRDIYGLMKDGVWRTLDQIERATGDPQASISARLRDLRKPRWGSHTVDRRRKGLPRRGLWEYRLEVVE